MSTYRSGSSTARWSLSTLLGGLVVTAAISSIPARADDAMITDADLAGDIPIRLSTLHVFFDLRINGSEPLNFGFDTGAPFTILEESTARRLGLEGEGEFQIRGGGEGSITGSWVPDLSFELPGAKVHRQRAAMASLSILGRVGGSRVDGIIGNDLMRHFVVEIDYAANRMRVHDPETFEYKGDGCAIPLENLGGILRMSVSVTLPGRDPVECKVFVDSGAALNFLFTSPYVRKHDLLSAMPETTEGPEARGVGGLIKSRTGRIDSIEIGPYLIDKPSVNFSQAQAGAAATNMADGILGAGLLSRFKVIYDLDRDRMILEPNAQLDEPVTVDLPDGG